MTAISIEVGLASAGEDVALVQSLLVALGHPIGTYETDKGRFGPMTVEAVKSWQRKRKLEVTGRLEEASLARLREDARQLPRVVRGVISLADGTPVPGLRVIAHDIDFRAEEKLGEAITDHLGRYQIPYTMDSCARAEKLNADIVVSVFKPRGRTLLNPPAPGQTRDILMNAAFDAVVDIVVTRAESGLPTEFERITAELRPLVSQTPFADIARDRPDEEGIFLARETGLSVDRVAHFAVAHRLAEKGGASPEFFYALLRINGLFGLDPTRLHAVNAPVDFATDTHAVLFEAALLDSDEIKDAIEKAIKRFIVPGSVERELAKAIAYLAKLRAEADAFAGTERPRQVLETIEDLILSGKAQDLLALFGSYDPHDLPAMQAKLEAGKDLRKGKKDEATARLGLAELLGFSAPLVEEVSRTKGVKKPADVRKLAKLNRADWSEVLETSSSLRIGGAPVAPEAARIQASRIVRSFEKAFPTTAFTAQLARRKPQIVNNLTDVIDLLEAHPEFELQKHNLLPFLAAAGVDTTTIPKAVIQDIEKVQRIFVLTGSYSATEALIGAGYGASADIVAAGQKQFIADAAKHANMQEADAKRIFQAAQATNFAAITLATNLRIASPMSAGGQASSLRTANGAPTSIEKFGGVSPDLESLFFSGDYCACDHENSIYGPAAYLADILGFLKKRLIRKSDGSIGTGAKDVLFERRPDIGEIDLNGPNATTPVPHIDIVCQLLEEAVAASPEYVFSGSLSTGAIPNRVVSAALIAAIAAEGHALTNKAQLYGPYGQNGNFMLRDADLTVSIEPSGTDWKWRILRQTHGSAEERAAAPEYVNAAAYSVLASGKAAFSLPFDLPHAETRGYLAAAGIDRAEMMRAYQVTGSPTDAAIDGETLGLSANERTLIETDDPSIFADVWGITSAADMAMLDVFSAKTGLKYEAIETLIRLPFIRGSENLFIHHLDNSCDLSKKRIENFTDEVLDRIHRVLRLARKTGLSFAEVARIASAPKIGANELNGATLANLAEIKRLSRDIGVSIPTLVTWLDVIPHGGEASQHAKLFETPAITGPIDPKLSAASIGTTTSPPLLADPAIISGIAVALRAKEADVLAVATSQAFTSTLNLDFGTLGEVCGRIELARSLRLSIRDLVALEELLPQPVLANPSSLRAFYEAVEAIKQTGIKAAELVDQIAPSLDALIVRDAADKAEITSTLTELRTALVGAIAKHANLFKPLDTGTDDADANLAENLAAFQAQLVMQYGFDQTRLEELLDIVRKPVLSDGDVTAAKVALDSNALGLDTTAKSSIGTSIDAVKAATGGSILTAQSNYISTAMAAISVVATERAKAAALNDAMSNWLKVDAEICALTLGTSTEALGLNIAGNSLAANLFGLATFDGAITPSTRPIQFQSARLLKAAHRLLSPFSPTAEALITILNHAAGLGWLQLQTVPFESGSTPVSLSDWRTLAEVFSLSKRFLPRPVGGVPTQNHSVWATFDQLATTAVKADLLVAFSTLTGRPLQVVTDVDTSVGNPVSEYFSPLGWMRLDTAVSMAVKLEAPASEIMALAKETLTDQDRVAAQRIIGLRYSPADWVKVLKTVMDPIREMKRDALCAHLLVTNPGLTSTADLYDHFLMDPEWSAKMPSSLIVAAISAIQTFVLRCMSGLEPEAKAATVEDPDWRQWEWMSTYREWEVARKVFIEAEYYLRPEWRDDKTELFEAFDRTLQQNEINKENVDAAFESYLNDLDQIAFMDVLTTCYDFTLNNLHVFAVTKGGAPGLYYHCVLQNERIWTAWKKIDLDITGDHLSAFFRNGRLCLAWLTFLEKGDDEQDVPYPEPGSSMVRPKRYTEISLAVSEYTGKRWLTRKISASPLNTPFSEKALDRKNILMIVNPDEDLFTIDIYLYPKEANNPAERIGYFLLTGCKGYPEAFVTEKNQAHFFPKFKDSLLKGQRFVEQNKDGDDDLAFNREQSDGQDVVLFNKTPGIFRVTYPLYPSELDKLFPLLSRCPSPIRRKLGSFMPFFFEDNQRGYMLLPGFFERRKEGTAQGQSRTFSALRRIVIDTLSLMSRYVRRFEFANQIQNRTQRRLEIGSIRADLAKDDDYHRLLAEWQLLARMRYGIQAQNFYHPMLCSMRQKFFSGGVRKMLSRAAQLEIGPFIFESQTQGYAPTPAVVTAYPVQELEFGRDRVYGTYNWELAFHIPFMIADKLMAEEKFDEAEQWLKLIFDPQSTTNAPRPDNDSSLSSTARYWNTKPFFLRTEDEYRRQLIDNVMMRVAKDVTGMNDVELADSILEWRRNFAKPFIIARGRTTAFQRATVYKMINLFIAQGDSYFRRDTLESLVSASLYYSRAERLLGKRPDVVPHGVDVPPETYNQLESSLDLFSNAIRGLENLVPDITTLPEGGDELPPPVTLESLYFCIPPSEKLYDLWDLLEERQFNLRNSRTIDGSERSLALFAPPLSVEALIQASANGLSPADIQAGMSSPRPLYRFRVMLRHAIELADVASGFSREMEQALSSKDAEGLNRLKLAQEIRLHNEQTSILQQEIAAASTAIASARQGRRVHEENQKFYSGRPYMNGLENAATAAFGVSFALQAVMAVGYAATGVLSAIPDFMVGVAGVGGSPAFNAETGGERLSSTGHSLLVGTIGAISGAFDKAGSMLSQQASYQLRQEEWDHSTQLAELEMERSDLEITIAGIREAIAKQQLRMHEIKKQQMAAEEAYIKSKFTNQELFDWLAQELRGLSKGMFNLALAAARAAQNCFNFELGEPDNFITSGHWKDNRKGLLAASNLVVDLRKMETQYYARNKREREMAKHVSIARLDPMALLQLRATGACTINLPEAIFDLDHPGQYFRRIKFLSVSIPGVVGPYTSIGLKLTQVSNRIRSKVDNAPYAEDPAGDGRFRYNVASGQSIETSKGEDDSGLFSLNLDDERYLPFEGSGLCGQYRLELPKDLRSFDYETISDIILHIRYTARDGGGAFRESVTTSLREQLGAIKSAAGESGLFTGINLRRDRPELWHKLKTGGTCSLTISWDDIPYFAAAAEANIQSIQLWVKKASNGDPVMTIDGADVSGWFPPSSDYQGIHRKTLQAVTSFGETISIGSTAVESLRDLYIFIGYNFAQ